MKHSRTTLGRRAQPVSRLDLSIRLGVARAIEGLWLVAVGLVPVVFGPPQFLFFVDVPKVTLLRSAVALMAMLWALQWALQPARSPVAPGQGLRALLSPGALRHPSRGIVSAATLVLAAAAIATLFSVSLGVSTWGWNPGRDGTSLYTHATYNVLFVIVAFNLKTKQQLWRLLGAIAAGATVAAIFGVLQRFGLDAFSSGTLRVDAYFGNALFAASYLVLAFPLSLGLALVHARQSRSPWVARGWVGVLALQLAAIMFTESRGPWIGLLLAWLALLSLFWLMGNRKVLISAAAMTGTARRWHCW